MRRRLLGNRRGNQVAQTFIEIAQLTNPVHISAVQQLETDLKAANLWDKMVAVYPVVGGTALSCKFNLIDPRDTDDAFRLTPITMDSNVYSDNGIKPASRMNTFVTPNSHLLLNSTHLSFYSRENITIAAVEMGIQGGNDGLFIAPSFNGTNYRAVNNSQVEGNNGQNVAAYFIATRIASNQSKQFRNGVVINTDNVNSATLSTRTISLFGYTPLTAAYVTQRQCAFASIGFGLTDVEAVALDTIVQNYNTALGRAIAR